MSARVVLFGYDELVMAALDSVRASGGVVPAAVFPSTRRADARVSAVRADVEAAGVPTLEQPRRDRVAPFVEALRTLEPDLLLVWSYPMILPPLVLSVPRLGALNLHMGLLPEYRGPNGVQWAIIDGASHTGVTLHYMDEGVDTGPMLAQARVPIGAEDDVVDVLRACRDAGVALLGEGWAHYSARRLSALPQDEGQARYRPRRTREDDRIDWTQGAERIRNLVRATAHPWPGAFTRWRGGDLVVRACTVRAAGAGPPGRIVSVDGSGLVVSAGDGALLLTRLERNGSPIPPAALGAAPGDRLG